MSDLESYDLAIVGGGLVGAALALSITKQSEHCRIALIDAQSPDSALSQASPGQQVDDFEPRVSALTQASIDLLTGLGIWDETLSQYAQDYQAMQVWDELGTAEINFTAAELHHNELGYIIENQRLLTAMQQQLTHQPNLTCLWNQRINALSTEQDQSVLYLGDRKISSNLIIGADGANSKVRQLSGLATREWDYEHTAIVCTVETELSHEQTARQRFSEKGPLAFLPLMDAEQSGKFSSIVWSLTNKEADMLLQLEADQFKHKLESEIENRLGKIVQVSKRFSFPLRQRHAKDYVKEGIALVGDAAHTIHPLAGQGVNLGFKDVAVLSRLLNQALEQQLPLHHLPLLKRYQRERQGDNLLMMGAMEGFKQLFGSPSPMIRFLRNTGLDFVNQQSFIKNQLAKHAMGL